MASYKLSALFLIPFDYDQAKQLIIQRIREVEFEIAVKGFPPTQ